jgi:flagellar basal-body rod protein FlgB
VEIGSRLSEMLGRFLDVTSDQMKLTASNIANVDTPGFRTKGLDFHATFAQAMRDLGSESVAPMQEQVQDVDGLVARPDGNNVSIDRESMQLAKEQLQFRAGVELLKREYTHRQNPVIRFLSKFLIF